MTTILEAPPDLTITVTNHRPAPQGSKRYAGHRTSKTTGKSAAVLVEQSKRVKPFRKAVTEAAGIALLQAGAHQYRPWDEGRGCIICGIQPADHRLFRGPVAVEITFTVRKPASAPKTRVTWPATRDSGDIDKLQRAALDAISDAGGIWVDDSRVIEITARKVYPDEGVDALPQPGAIIRIWDLDMGEAR